MKNKSPKLKRGPQRTITFQPDEDARRVLETILGDGAPRGVQTTFINTAILLNAPKVALLLADQDVSEAVSWRDNLKTALQERPSSPA